MKAFMRQARQHNSSRHTTRWLAAVFLALGLLAGVAPPARAGYEEDNTRCFSCHGVPGLVRQDAGGRSVALDVSAAHFSSSLHGRRACVTCHRSASELPHRPGMARVGCTPCHHDGRLVEGRFHEAKRAWAAGESYALPTLTTDVRRTCLACHGHKDVAAETRPIMIETEQLDASVHRDLSCLDCHAGAQTIPHRPATAPPCGRCHQDEEHRYRLGIHVQAATGPNCITCHGKHDILPPANPLSRTHPLRVIEICAGCHGQALRTVEGQSPVDAYRKSIHADGIFRAGLVNSAVCNKCHGEHDVYRSADPRSSVNRKNVANTCGQCHEGIRDRYAASIHGRLLAAGNEHVPSCNDCHHSHEIAPSRIALDVQILRTGCGNCHEARRLSYDDSFHGKATSLGFIIAATCADCHTAHDILPASDTMSSVNTANLVATCRQCHTNANEHIATFHPHVEPMAASAPLAVRATYLAMSGLLMGTLFFFGLHTLLWFQRSIVGWRRGELELEGLKRLTGVHIRRFTEVQRLTHVLVIVSFLGLALTGLPLHYHDEGWAQFLAMLLGGVEVTRFLHRACAVITVGYFAIHLGSMLWRVIRERKIGFLFGADSMIPRLRDLGNFFEHLRWCLYLGPPAKVDRWTYWEKFDYFAIFWGVPIIGASGLVLWFPDFFSRWLPGYFFNLASIIHGDEALLATSFIFVIHFFHTHLRPESFPIDLSIFTGAVPLERFKRERPEHYQRLVAEGKLESLLIPPRPPEMVHAAMAFGFTALGIGLMLIISMIWVTLH